MPKPSYPIPTPRLTIRPYVAADFDALYSLQSRDDVARFLYWEPRDERQVREALHDRMTLPALDADGQVLGLAAELRGSGTYVGDLSLFLLSVAHRRGEIGFVLHPDFHGKGLASEAAGALLHLGFDVYGLQRIIGRCDARNTASARVMQRLGMRQEAHFVAKEVVKGEWTDELVYAMLASEWNHRPQPK